MLDAALSLPIYQLNIYETHIDADGVVTPKGVALKSLGALAQGVQKSFPSLVRGNYATEILRVDEAKYGVIALRALQEYAAKSDAKIAALEARLAALESK